MKSIEYPKAERGARIAHAPVFNRTEPDKLRAVLTTFGCKLSEEEVDDLLARASSAGGKFDVADFLSQCFA